MDWWENMGTYAMGMGQFPALASDMALRGPQGDFGYTLMHLMNKSATPIDVYPPDEANLAGLGG